MANSEIGVDVATTQLARQYKSPPFICAGFMGGQGSKAGGIAYSDEIAPTIKSSFSGSNSVPDVLCVHGSQDPITKHELANTVGCNNGLENCIYSNHENDISPTTIVPAVAIAENVIGRQIENGGNGIGALEELAYTQNATGVMGVCQNSFVRRLLPVECERLMGFPDNWTRIPWRGKPEEQCPDSHRYKACGNSMCVNVMRWIGMRIELTERKLK